MLIDEGLDTGPLLARVDYDLDDLDNSDTLTNNLIELSNQSLRHVLPLWLSDQAIPSSKRTAQSPTHASLPSKTDFLFSQKPRPSSSVKSEHLVAGQKAERQLRESTA